MWKTLYDTNMSWIDQKIVGLQWQFSNIKRFIKVEKSVVKGIKRWWNLRQICKKINKSLLRKVKEMENNGNKKD